MNKDLSKDFYRYVLPSMVSMLLSGFYSMVDGIFVGNAAGSQALAAINLVYPIQACMNATAFGLGVGGAVLMSKHMGSEEYEQADRAMGTTLSLLTIAGLGLMGFFWLTKDSIIHLLGATGEIAQYANEYISIIILCGIFPVLGNGVTPLIRNCGKTIEATLFMSSGLVTNILLDYVFVFRLRMGLAGAAIA
ncbi:MAG: MATE family efflux transporter, partial [Negativibacillus sp.]|nr:MATE family efflux transporter [Negativibacillus sp.]